MKQSNLLVQLSLLIALLALVSAAYGLFYQDGGQPFSFTTARGESVVMDGNGLYRYDSQLSAAVFRGTDAAMLVVAIPALLIATFSYRRGSFRGGLLLTSLLGCFVYNAFHAAFSIAYNSLFLIYAAYFSLSLFGFIYAVSLIDFQTLPARVGPKLPHRGIAIFLFVAGLTVFVWLIDIVGSMLQNRVPATLGPYTTSVTYAFDMGVLGPTIYLAGILMLRRAPLGYLLASTMLVLNTLIGLIVISQTVVPLLTGITLTAGEIAAFVAPFVITSLIAGWLTVKLYQNLSETPIKGKPIKAKKAGLKARA